MEAVLLAPAAEVERQSESLPGALRVVEGLGGLVALGASITLGADTVESPVLVTGSLLVGTVGALAMTTPTLLVGQQLLGLDAPPRALVATLLSTLAHTGRLALRLCPLVLFFAVGRVGFPFAAATAVLLVGAIGLAGGALRIVDGEPGPRRRSAAFLALGWMALCGLVAAVLTFRVLAPGLGA